MRGRHDRVPDRRAPGKLGGPLPGHQPHRGQASLGQAHQGNRWLADVLTECAWAAARSRDTYLAAQFWRLARRIGKKKAAIAVGHSILVICWYLLDGDCDYHDLGGDFFIRRDSDRARQRAVAQLPGPRLPGHPPTRRLTPGDSRFRRAMRQGAAWPAERPSSRLVVREHKHSWAS